MPKYLITGHYTPEGVKGVAGKGGTARVDAVRTLAESVGGSVESFYFAFGDSDFYVVVDLPDQAAAVAVSLIVNSAGAVNATTTVLVTPEEVDAGAQASPSYTPPGG
jgi:uncharacterized protein with GYD domain